MKTRPLFVIVIVAVALATGAAALRAAAVTAAAAAEEKQYRHAKDIPIGTEGGWDYASVDSEGHRLFVSHATQVVVIDTSTDKVAGTIADTPGVHGIAVAHDLGKAFVSNGRENKVSIVDLKTLATTSKVATGENPDAIMYEPSKQEVYAFNGRGKSATVIDAKSGNVVTTIPLDGKPEFAQADPKAGRVFVNLEDKNAIAVIDIASHTVKATWPIAPGEEASGMAFDAANHRLFIGCSNKLMLMVDSTNGKVVASVPIESGVDANSFDPQTKLAFSSNGEGTITVAHEDSPTKLTVVQTIKTQRGVRTMTIDPSTHRIYAAAAEYEPAPAPTADTPRPRPKMVAGSFKILVYELGTGTGSM
jgi:YVTN family beta-propeller protein